MTDLSQPHEYDGEGTLWCKHVPLTYYLRILQLVLSILALNDASALGLYIITISQQYVLLLGQQNKSLSYPTNTTTKLSFTTRLSPAIS